MKTVVIVNQSTGYLTVDVCNAFARKYDRVILIAGRVNAYPRSLDSKVEIVNICNYDKSSILKRVSTWVRGSFQIRRYLGKVDRGADVLYFTNPPMSYMWADRMANRFGIVEYDIYPDALKNVRCPEFVINWWRKRNIKIFDEAAGIITLGEGMKNLLSQYCRKEKITIIHNWSQSDMTERVSPEDNKFIKANNLQDKFVVLYSGNIGYTHNVESIILVAEALKHNAKVVFGIIGEGGKKAALMEMSKAKGLDNVFFSDYLSSEDFKYSMSCASLGVVTLTKDAAKVSVPSKTYNLLSYGIPLLNISTPDSELGAIVRQNDCGASFEANDIKGIVRFINMCTTDNAWYLQIRDNAKRASKFFTMANAEKYTEIFQE